LEIKRIHGRPWAFKYLGIFITFELCKDALTALLAHRGDQ
jgi:hypothetical protein